MSERKPPDKSKPARVAVRPEVESRVLLSSRRRCCLCVYLDGNDKTCAGQIAHVDRDHSNSEYDNLVYLCLTHHDQYDSRPSQSKRLTDAEVRYYRGELYARNTGSADGLSTEDVRKRRRPRTLADTKMCLFEIVLDTDFEQYTPEEQEQLLDEIQRILGAPHRPEFVKREPGSVRLLLRWPKHLAEQLIRAADEGILSDFDVVSLALEGPGLAREGNVALMAPPHALSNRMVFVYQRPLHPELFQIRASQIVRGAGYEVEIWVMDGAHAVHFRTKRTCVCELLIADEIEALPVNDLVLSFLAAGERDVEHRFADENLRYMQNLQTESLNPQVYRGTLEDLLEYVGSVDAVSHSWSDDAGRCLSLVDAQIYPSDQVHIQTYHLFAESGLVIRTVSLVGRADEP